VSTKPGQLHFDVSPTTGRSNICAARSKDDALFVRVLVWDNHHASKWGYVYSEWWDIRNNLG
jgi:hypothetical protein